jgi:hypothetical protein
MNTAATLAFATVMLLGMGGLTGLVWRDRRATAPPADDPLDAQHCPPPPRTIYEQTVHALGDPDHIDLTPPAFTW